MIYLFALGVLSVAIFFFFCFLEKKFLCLANQLIVLYFELAANLQIEYFMQSVYL